MERFVMSRITTLKKQYPGVQRRYSCLCHCLKYSIIGSFSITFYLFDPFNNFNYLLQHAEDLESGSMSDVESKYKKIYEDDINPFAAFSRKVFCSSNSCCLVELQIVFIMFSRSCIHCILSLSKQKVYRNIPFHLFNQIEQTVALRPANFLPTFFATL